MSKTIRKILNIMCAVAVIAVAPVLLAACDKTEKHTMEHHDAVAATCTTAGTYEYWHCTDCDKNYQDENGEKELEDIVQPALGHEYTHHNAVAATCTTAGSVEYWNCARCNKNFDAETNGNEITNTTVAALGHNYQYTYNDTTKKYDGVCSHDATHTDTKDAGVSEEYPYLVSTEAELAAAVKLTNDANKFYIQLQNDINYTQQSAFGTGKKIVVIDLNNKTLNLTAIIGIIGDSSVTFNGGKIVSTSDVAFAQVGLNGSDKAELILNNVEVTAQNGNGVNLFDDCAMLLVNSRLTAKDIAIATNNEEGDITGQTIRISNSYVTSTDDAALFLSSFTKTSIYDSEITGKDAALNVMMGEILVKNSTLKSTGTDLKIVNTKDQIGSNGTKGHGATPIVIRANWYYDDNVKTNKLVLQLDNVNFVTATNVNVLVYNGNNEGGMTAGKEGVVDQMLAVRTALANVQNVKYYVVNSDNTVTEEV